MIAQLSTLILPYCLSSSNSSSMRNHENDPRYHQFLPRQIDARFILPRRNAITITITMFSMWIVTAFQQRFSQYERIIALIAAVLSVYQEMNYSRTVQPKYPG